jgi:hypothetical protein
MNWQHTPQDGRPDWLTPEERATHHPRLQELADAYMRLQLERAWDRHSERMELEREPVAVSDARFLRSLKIAPMEGE